MSDPILEYRDMMRGGGYGPHSVYAKAFRKNHASDADFTRRAGVLDKLWQVRRARTEASILEALKGGPLTAPEVSRKLRVKPYTEREEFVADTIIDLIDRHIVGIDEQHCLFVS
jgi:hypothetical protein